MDAEEDSQNAKLKRCLSSSSIINNKINLAIQEKIAMSSIQSKPVVINSGSAREPPIAPSLNIFAPRARRYSTSFSPTAGPRLTPRVSQLRQEECADITNSREVTHEREIHSVLHMSQSWEDLSLDAESWSFKSTDSTAVATTSTDLSNPLHVTLPNSPFGQQNCSSPSPTSRTAIRLPYGLSPSPTRRTFATRRSMSPIAMRPSSLGPVKRKFDIDDNNYANAYSPPPFKKMFIERGNSPICQSPSLTCPSPDSTEGRTTPKLYVSKLYTNSMTNSSSSLSSSPSAPSPSMEIQIDLPSSDNNSNSSGGGIGGGIEPMKIASANHDDNVVTCSDNTENAGNVDKNGAVDTDIKNDRLLMEITPSIDDEENRQLNAKNNHHTDENSCIKLLDDSIGKDENDVKTASLQPSPENLNGSSQNDSINTLINSNEMNSDQILNLCAENIINTSSDFNM